MEEKHSRQPDEGREGYDPEFEIPDPEQVDEDREEAERIYRNDIDDEDENAA